MIILNVGVLAEAAARHRDAAASLERWRAITADVDWRSLLDVRRTFPTADGVSLDRTGRVVIVATVFNTRGNRYRLITIIDYAAGTVSVRFLLTHAEYDTGRWKGQL